MVEYDPGWVAQFRIEHRKIARVCAAFKPEIEHLGSTSVPGLVSKPIVDVLIGLRDGSLLSAIYDAPDITGELLPRGDTGHVSLVRAIQRLGYRYRGENGIPGRLFMEVHEPGRELHLHITRLDSKFWRDHLRFRDVLRSNPQVTHQYAELKRTLASQYRNDRAGYTDTKSDFITECLCPGR